MSVGLELPYGGEIVRSEEILQHQSSNNYVIKGKQTISRFSSHDSEIPGGQT